MPIAIAPHLQRALEAMSRDMAVEEQALVNQAVFAWLRINGYVLPGAALSTEPPAPAPVRSLPTPVPAPVASAPDPVAVIAAAAAPLSAPVTPVAPPAVDLGPALVRMAEIDADLQKLTKPWPPWAPEPKAEEEEEEEEAPPAEEEDQLAADEPEAEQEEEPAAAAAPPEEPEESEESDEPDLEANTGETNVEEPAESTIVLRSVPIALYLEREGEEPLRVTAERFIIGRGPHCDLVIDSPRVSREHVALTRSGVMYFIEDLNSSNGTWFGEERVTKRELESGDVIKLGNEPVTFFLRGE
jgi:hypothetical protein